MSDTLPPASNDHGSAPASDRGAITWLIRFLGPMRSWDLQHRKAQTDKFELSREGRVPTVLHERKAEEETIRLGSCKYAGPRSRSRAVSPLWPSNSPFQTLSAPTRVLPNSLRRGVEWMDFGHDESWNVYSLTVNAENLVVATGCAMQEGYQRPQAY